jgi:hypothetical protein
MRNSRSQKVWVTVRVWRGLVSDVRAYRDEGCARRQESSWRRRMNLDYDDTGVAGVLVREGRLSPSQR